MTKKISAILSVLSCLCIFPNAFGQGKVTIKGKIQHPNADTVSISYSENKIAYFPVKHYSKLDKEHGFSLSFDLPPGYTQVQMQYGNKLADLLLEPGDNLAMTVNTDHFDSTIRYTGKGSEVQNFIAKHAIEKEGMNQYSEKVRPYVPKEPAEFEKGIQGEQSKEMAFLKNNSKGLSANFVNYWTDFYKYYNYFYSLQYPQVHEMVKKQRYTDTIPDEDYSPLTKVPYSFNDSLIETSPYLLYLTSIFHEKIKAGGYTYHGSDTISKRKFEDSVKKIALKLLPEKSAAYFFSQDLYIKAKNQPIAKTETEFAFLKKQWPKNEYLPTVERQVAIAEKLAPGQPAPDIAIYDSTGKKIMLSDLKGKVVYLGFWAEWCRQCVGEMISEKKIKDLIHDKPLAFVYISIGNDTAKENMIFKRYKIDGYTVRLNGGWDAPELIPFGVQTLPAYYLIDEEGKFAVQSPPTPLQSTELILAIEKLFK